MLNLACFTLPALLLAATLSQAQQPAAPAAAPVPPVAAQPAPTPPQAPQAAQQPPQPQQPPALNELEQLKAENLQLKIQALTKEIQDFEAVFTQVHPGWGVNIQTGQVVPAQQPQMQNRPTQAPRPQRPAPKPTTGGK